jgi:hypothetical protein
MRRTGRVLILLFALASPGCAKGDWTETLTLVDVTGTWTGTVVLQGQRATRTVQLVLQQRGASVTGQVARPGYLLGGYNVDGVINGELFTFTLGTLRGAATVSGDDMVGRADSGGFVECPCRISLRRDDTADRTQKGR